MARTDPRRALCRRGVLAGLASGLGAGCLALGGGRSGSGGSDGGDTTTTTAVWNVDMSWGGEFSERGIRARPADVAVQRSVHVRSDDGATVSAADGRRFVFLSIVTGHAVGLAPPDPADFAIAVDGDRSRGWTTHEAVDGRPHPDDFPHHYGERGEDEQGRTVEYGRGRVPGWIGFDVPAPVTGAPRLVLHPTQVARPYAHWPLPDRTVERLRAPPADLVLGDVTLPESVGAGEAITAAVSAQNAGESAATFRVALDAEGVAPVLGTVPLGAGETGTWEGSIPAPGGADAVEVAVLTGAGDVTREVRTD